MKLYIYAEFDYDFHRFVVATDETFCPDDFAVLECSEEEACALLQEQERQDEFQDKLGWLYTATAPRTYGKRVTKWGFDEPDAT